jgi:hypothetical protein
MAQPPLNWVASVEIFLGELPELKKFVDWYIRLLKLSREILLWGAVESRGSLIGVVGWQRRGCCLCRIVCLVICVKVVLRHFKER